MRQTATSAASPSMATQQQQQRLPVYSPPPLTGVSPRVSSASSTQQQQQQEAPALTGSLAHVSFSVSSLRALYPSLSLEDVACEVARARADVLRASARAHGASHRGAGGGTGSGASSTGDQQARMVSRALELLQAQVERKRTHPHEQGRGGGRTVGSFNAGSVPQVPPKQPEWQQRVQSAQQPRPRTQTGDMRIPRAAHFFSASPPPPFSARGSAAGSAWGTPSSSGLGGGRLSQTPVSTYNNGRPMTTQGLAPLQYMDSTPHAASGGRGGGGGYFPAPPMTAPAGAVARRESPRIANFHFVGVHRTAQGTPGMHLVHDGGSNSEAKEQHMPFPPPPQASSSFTPLSSARGSGPSTGARSQRLPAQTPSSIHPSAPAFTPATFDPPVLYSPRLHPPPSFEGAGGKGSKGKGKNKKQDKLALLAPLHAPMIDLSPRVPREQLLQLLLYFRSPSSPFLRAAPVDDARGGSDSVLCSWDGPAQGAPLVHAWDERDMAWLCSFTGLGGGVDAVRSAAERLAAFETQQEPLPSPASTPAFLASLYSFARALRLVAQFPLSHNAGFTPPAGEGHASSPSMSSSSGAHVLDPYLVYVYGAYTSVCELLDSSSAFSASQAAAAATAADQLGTSFSSPMISEDDEDGEFGAGSPRGSTSKKSPSKRRGGNKKDKHSASAATEESDSQSAVRRAARPSVREVVAFLETFCFARGDNTPVQDVGSLEDSAEFDQYFTRLQEQEKQEEHPLFSAVRLVSTPFRDVARLLAKWVKQSANGSNVRSFDSLAAIGQAIKAHFTPNASFSSATSPLGRSGRLEQQQQLVSTRSSPPATASSTNESPRAPSRSGSVLKLKNLSVNSEQDSRSVAAASEWPAIVRERLESIKQLREALRALDAPLPLGEAEAEAAQASSSPMMLSPTSAGAPSSSTLTRTLAARERALRLALRSTLASVSARARLSGLLLFHGFVSSPPQAALVVQQLVAQSESRGGDACRALHLLQVYLHQVETGAVDDVASGGGAESWAELLEALDDVHDTFRRELLEVAELLAPHAPSQLLRRLFPPTAASSAGTAGTNNTPFSPSASMNAGSPSNASTAGGDASSPSNAAGGSSAGPVSSPRALFAPTVALSLAEVELLLINCSKEVVPDDAAVGAADGRKGKQSQGQNQQGEPSTLIKASYCSPKQVVEYLHTLSAFGRSFNSTGAAGGSAQLWSAIHAIRALHAGREARARLGIHAEHLRATVQGWLQPLSGDMLCALFSEPIDAPPQSLLNDLLRAGDDESSAAERLVVSDDARMEELVVHLLYLSSTRQTARTPAELRTLLRTLRAQRAGVEKDLMRWMLTHAPHWITDSASEDDGRAIFSAPSLARTLYLRSLAGPQCIEALEGVRVARPELFRAPPAPLGPGSRISHPSRRVLKLLRARTTDVAARQRCELEGVLQALESVHAGEHSAVTSTDPLFAEAVCLLQGNAHSSSNVFFPRRPAFSLAELRVFWAEVTASVAPRNVVPLLASLAAGLQGLASGERLPAPGAQPVAVDLARRLRLQIQQRRALSSLHELALAVVSLHELEAASSALEAGPQSSHDEQRAPSTVDSSAASFSDASVSASSTSAESPLAILESYLTSPHTSLFSPHSQITLTPALLEHILHVRGADGDIWTCLRTLRALERQGSSNGVRRRVIDSVPALLTHLLEYKPSVCARVHQFLTQPLQGGRLVQTSQQSSGSTEPSTPATTASEPDSAALSYESAVAWLASSPVPPALMLYYLHLLLASVPSPSAAPSPLFSSLAALRHGAHALHALGLARALVAEHVLEDPVLVELDRAGTVHEIQASSSSQHDNSAFGQDEIEALRCVLVQNADALFGPLPEQAEEVVQSQEKAAVAASDNVTGEAAEPPTDEPEAETKEADAVPVTSSSSVTPDVRSELLDDAVVLRMLAASHSYDAALYAIQSFLGHAGVERSGLHGPGATHFVSSRHLCMYLEEHRRAELLLKRRVFTLLVASARVPLLGVAALPQFVLDEIARGDDGTARILAVAPSTGKGYDHESGHDWSALDALFSVAEGEQRPGEDAPTLRLGAGMDALRAMQHLAERATKPFLSVSEAVRAASAWAQEQRASASTRGAAAAALVPISAQLHSMLAYVTQKRCALWSSTLTSSKPPSSSSPSKTKRRLGRKPAPAASVSPSSEAPVHWVASQQRWGGVALNFLVLQRLERESGLGGSDGGEGAASKQQLLAALQYVGEKQPHPAARSIGDVIAWLRAFDLSLLLPRTTPRATPRTAPRKILSLEDGAAGDESEGKGYAAPPRDDGSHTDAAGEHATEDLAAETEEEEAEVDDEEEEELLPQFHALQDAAEAEIDERQRHHLLDLAAQVTELKTRLRESSSQGAALTPAALAALDGLYGAAKRASEQRTQEARTELASVAATLATESWVADADAPGADSLTPADLRVAREDEALQCMLQTRLSSAHQDLASMHAEQSAQLHASLQAWVAANGGTRAAAAVTESPYHEDLSATLTREAETIRKTLLADFTRDSSALEESVASQLTALAAEYDDAGISQKQSIEVVRLPLARLKALVASQSQRVCSVVFRLRSDFRRERSAHETEHLRASAPASQRGPCAVRADGNIEGCALTFLPRIYIARLEEFASDAAKLVATAIAETKQEIADALASVRATRLASMSPEEREEFEKAARKIQASFRYHRSRRRSAEMHMDDEDLVASGSSKRSGSGRARGARPPRSGGQAAPRHSPPSAHPTLLKFLTAAGCNVLEERTAHALSENESKQLLEACAPQEAEGEAPLSKSAAEAQSLQLLMQYLRQMRVLDVSAHQSPAQLTATIKLLRFNDLAIEQALQSYVSRSFILPGRAPLSPAALTSLRTLVPQAAVAFRVLKVVQLEERLRPDREQRADAPLFENEGALMRSIEHYRDESLRQLSTALARHSRQAQSANNAAGSAVSVSSPPGSPAASSSSLGAPTKLIEGLWLAGHGCSRCILQFFVPTVDEHEKRGSIDVSDPDPIARLDVLELSQRASAFRASLQRSNASISAALERLHILPRPTEAARFSLEHLLAPTGDLRAWEICELPTVAQHAHAALGAHPENEAAAAGEKGVYPVASATTLDALVRFDVKLHVASSPSTPNHLLGLLQQFHDRVARKRKVTAAAPVFDSEAALLRAVHHVALHAVSTSPRKANASASSGPSAARVEAVSFLERVPAASPERQSSRPDAHVRRQVQFSDDGEDEEAKGSSAAAAIPAVGSLEEQLERERVESERKRALLADQLAAAEVARAVAEQKRAVFEAAAARATAQMAQRAAALDAMTVRQRVAAEREAAALKIQCLARGRAARQEASVRRAVRERLAQEVRDQALEEERRLERRKTKRRTLKAPDHGSSGGDMARVMIERQLSGDTAVEVEVVVNSGAESAVPALAAAAVVPLAFVASAVTLPEAEEPQWVVQVDATGASAPVAAVEDEYEAEFEAEPYDATGL